MTRLAIIYMDSFVCRNGQDDILAYSKWVESRLFQCIGSWDEEEDRATKEYEERASCPFDGERHDPASFYEEGYENVISECLQVAEVNGYMIGVAIAGLYHLWEKQIVNHLAREIAHDWKVDEKHLPSNWIGILNTFKSYSTDLVELPCYPGLNELRLVTNTVKHGGGVSFQNLRKLEASITQPYPHSEDQPLSGGSHALLRADIYPHKEHFLAYRDAVMAFWDYDYWRQHGERLPFKQWCLRGMMK